MSTRNEREAHAEILQSIRGGPRALTTEEEIKEVESRLGNMHEEARRFQGTDYGTIHYGDSQPGIRLLEGTLRDLRERQYRERQAERRRAATEESAPFQPLPMYRQNCTPAPAPKVWRMVALIVVFAVVMFGFVVQFAGGWTP